MLTSGPVCSDGRESSTVTKEFVVDQLPASNEKENNNVLLQVIGSLQETEEEEGGGQHVCLIVDSHCVAL